MLRNDRGRSVRHRLTLLSSQPFTSHSASSIYLFLGIGLGLSTHVRTTNESLNAPTSSWPPPASPRKAQSRDRTTTSGMKKTTSATKHLQKLRPSSPNHNLSAPNPPSLSSVAPSPPSAA